MHGGDQEQIEDALGVVGPQDEPSKYSLHDKLWEQNTAVAHLGQLRVGDISLLVTVWMSPADAATDQAWLDTVAQHSATRHHGAAVVREGFIGPPPPQPVGGPDGNVRYLVTNTVEGESLRAWLAARPDRDPVGILSLLIPVAAALDLLHEGDSDAVSHGRIDLDTIMIAPDQTATLWSPSTELLHEVNGGHRVDRVAEDRRQFAATVFRVITGRDPSGEDELSGFMEGSGLENGENKTPLVHWLADLRGATITPGATQAVPLDEVKGSKNTTRRARRSGWLWVVVAVAMAGCAFGAGWAANDNQTTQTALPALDCVPEAYAEEAEDFIESTGLAFGWADPDGDCYHTSYEIHWLGSDYLVANPDLTGQRPTAAMQIRVLINFYEDATSVRGINPAVCLPEVVAVAAEAYIERTGLVVSWVDTDADCVSDVWELNAMGTDPSVPDSDGDGTLDSLDPKAGNGGLLVPIDEQLIFAVDVHARNHRNGDDVEATDPAQCSPLAWQRAVQTYLGGIDMNLPWDDPDQDCVHTVYEVDVLETDPTDNDSDDDGILDGNDPDHGDGMIAPIDRQYDYILLAGG